MFGRKKKHRCGDWRIVRRRFNPPPSGGVKVTLWEEKDLQEVIFGFTIIEEHCGGCNKARFTRVLGNALIASEERQRPSGRNVRFGSQDQATPGKL